MAAKPSYEQLVKEGAKGRLVEQAFDLSQRFFAIASGYSDTRSLLEELVAEIKKFTGCAAVGIRILDDEGNIPYHGYTGFSDSFFESESPLSIKSDECMCINVIKGDTDPAQPFYTEAGSFFMNGTTRFLATVSEEDKGQTRNVCNEVGYESVALVPIYDADRIYGLVHLADTREDRVPLDMVKVLENTTKHLGTAIQRVATAEALQKEKSLSEDYINSLPGLFYVFDEQQFVRWNQEWETVTGYSSNELGEMYGTDFFEGSDRALIADRMKAVFIEGTAEADATLVTKDGRRIPYYFTGSRKEIGGRNHLVGLGINITERRKAEEQIAASLEEKEVLLREIHHRVKNNMQVIVSLLRMHSRRIDDERLQKIFDDCRDRINAMSLIHEALYQSENLAQIDLQDYVGKLCQNLSQAYSTSGNGITVTVDGSTTALDIDQGVAVGMVISELISNAFLHAFPLGNGGMVSVSLSHLKGREIELIVQDNGQGLPPEIDILNPPSLGLRLVAAAVTRELGGSLEVERDGGTRVIIRFKCKGG